MPTAIEELFRRGEEAVYVALADLNSYMLDPVRQCALRTMLLGVARIQRRGQFNWSLLLGEWNRLLSSMPAPSTRNTRRAKAETLQLGEHDIPRFAFLENLPRQPMRTAKLALLVAHRAEQLESQPYPGRLLYESGVDACDCLTQISDYLRGDQTALTDTPDEAVAPVDNTEQGTGAAELVDKALAKAKDGDLEALVVGAIRATMQVDKTELQRIQQRFFDARDLTSVSSDRSYYVAYRYSTQHPEIVRTFLVIDGPKLSGVDAFSFVHFYESPKKRIKRITRGMLLGFEETYYFVGGTAKVLRGKDDKGRPRIDRPSGLKVIAIPDAQVRTDEAIPAGIYLSNSLSLQPIVGRIALLHLGYMSDIGELRDSEVRPGIVQGPEQLSNDLRKFSELPNVSLPGKIADVAEEILGKINNLPQCDRRRSDLQSVGIIRALLAEDGQEPGP